MKLATWNVNSIRARTEHVMRFLRARQPDMLFLQEIKCEAAAFPSAVFEEAGYRAVVVGQKSYNGVAALSRIPFSLTHRCLPGEDEAQAAARYVGVEAEGLAIGGLYLPNGNSGGEAGYQAKLDWMDRLNARAAALVAAETPCLFLGDFNVCPEDRDYAPGTLGADDALVRAPTRERFRQLQWMGFTDAVRAMQQDGPAYTFWDYQAGAWQKDRGLRIDHAMLSPAVAERLVTVTRCREERGQTQPSDHVPVIVELSPA
jgi:exodeoxyribonuclease-3